MMLLIKIQLNISKTNDMENKNITAGELIKLLSKYPESTSVKIHSYPNDYCTSYIENLTEKNCVDGVIYQDCAFLSIQDVEEEIENQTRELTKRRQDYQEQYQKWCDIETKVRSRLLILSHLNITDSQPVYIQGRGYGFFTLKDVIRSKAAVERKLRGIEKELCEIIAEYNANGGILKCLIIDTTI